MNPRPVLVTRYVAEFGASGQLLSADTAIALVRALRQLPESVIVTRVYEETITYWEPTPEIPAMRMIMEQTPKQPRKRKPRT